MLQLFNSDHESDSVRKYDNLNLNQQSAKRFDHIFEGNSGPHNNFLDKQSKRPSKLFGLLNLNEDKKKNDEKKGCDSPNTNNNTLSIHIAAFENCVEVYRVNVEEKLNPWQVDKRLSVMASVSFQNPFEFSRQQENKKVPDPEISQFKSLQKLFNPNVPIPKRRDEEPSTNEPLQKKIKKGECLSNITPKRDTTNNSLRDLGKLILSSPSTSAPHVQIVNNNPASPQNNATEKIKTEKDQNTIAVLRKGLDAYEQKLNTLEEEKKVLNEKLTRSRMDVQKQKKQIERITEKKLLEDVEHEKTIQMLNDEISLLKEEIQQFAEKQGIAVLFENGKYTLKAKHGMGQLKVLGVADAKVGPVIKAVLGMVDLEPNRIPSASTVARASFYVKALNNAQIREVLLDAAQRDITTTLGSDETTKNGNKLEAFVLFTLDEENKAREYCLGMVDILDKAAATAVEKLKQIIQSLESEDGSQLWETFIMTVGNAVSDQARTQTRFNYLVESIKKVIVDNDERWNHLNEDEKKDLYKLRAFYCQLHILQNATPVVTTVLLEHEKRFRGNDEMNEASVVKLIKEGARFAGANAASKYDVHGKWTEWAKRNGIKFANIPDFKHHRFNILFSIASSLQFLKDDLLKFDKEFKTKLREAEIQKWMNDPLTSSHLLILAAVNEFITAPFWRLTENDTSISSITSHATSLINFLERVKDDPMLLLTGEPPLEEYEEDFEIKERSKAHIQKLDNTVPEHPLIINEAIEDVAEALLAYFKKQFKDFLPGGIHYQSDGETTKTVPRSNRRCESIFGLATWLFQHAPNQRTVVREAKILAIVNKVFEWFDNKSLEEKEKLIKEALDAAPKLESDAAKQVKALEDATWKKLLEQKEADDKAEKVKSRKEREAVEKVAKYGGHWKSISSMNLALGAFGSESEKKKAIVDNLRYHKLILKTTSSNSKLFTITSGGQAKTLSTLIENLSALITTANQNTTEDDDQDDNEY